MSDKLPVAKRRRKSCVRTMPPKGDKSNMAASAPAGEMKDGKNLPGPCTIPPAFAFGMAGAQSPQAPMSINPWQVDYSNKLDFIVNKLTSIETKQTTLLSRLSTIETNLIDTNKKVTDIEHSQILISEKYDTVQKSTQDNKRDIDLVKGDVKKLTSEEKELSDQNKKLKDDIIDLKCRSMRDNLLFFGIPESNVMATINNRDSEAAGNARGASAMDVADTGDTDSQQSQSLPASQTASYSAKVVQGENCVGLVHDFCKNVLKIEDPESSILIDRAHRVGSRSVGKTRPIVAKLVRTKDKEFIKQASKIADLRSSDFRVADQFPQEVLARRKELIPKMVDARKNGNKAVLVRDKLYINNKLVE